MFSLNSEWQWCFWRVLLHSTVWWDWFSSLQLDDQFALRFFLVFCFVGPLVVSGMSNSSSPPPTWWPKRLWKHFQFDLPTFHTRENFRKTPWSLWVLTLGVQSTKFSFLRSLSNQILWRDPARRSWVCSLIFGFHSRSNWQFGVENKLMVPWPWKLKWWFLTTIFPGTIEDVSFTKTLEKWLSLTNELESPLDGIQKNWTQPVFVETALELISRLDDKRSKVFNAHQGKLGSQWLNVVPCKNQGLKLDD